MLTCLQKTFPSIKKKKKINLQLYNYAVQDGILLTNTSIFIFMIKHYFVE